MESITKSIIAGIISTVIGGLILYEITTYINNGSSIVQLLAPTPIYPECGNAIKTPENDKMLVFKWTPVAGASNYTVEVDCFSCDKKDEWYSLSGSPWHIKHSLGFRTITSPIYSSMIHKKSGNRPLRWRVWAVDSEGREGMKSQWCQVAFYGNRIPPTNPRLDELKTLINRNVATHTDKPDVALVIDSPKTPRGLSPENLLYGLLRIDEVNIISNFFKEEEFKSKGFFREIYDGNTELLIQTDALSKINYLILGKLDYSFQRRLTIDKDVITCYINFSYKIIDKDANIEIGSIPNITGVGFSEDEALEVGLENLASKYSEIMLKQIF